MHHHSIRHQGSRAPALPGNSGATCATPERFGLQQRRSHLLHRSNWSAPPRLVWFAPQHWSGAARVCVCVCDRRHPVPFPRAATLALKVVLAEGSKSLGPRPAPGPLLLARRPTGAQSSPLSRGTEGRSWRGGEREGMRGPGRGANSCIYTRGNLIRSSAYTRQSDIMGFTVTPHAPESLYPATRHLASSHQRSASHTRHHTRQTETTIPTNPHMVADNLGIIAPYQAATHRTLQRRVNVQ